jgi:hypothetical protein
VQVLAEVAATIPREDVVLYDTRREGSALHAKLLLAFGTRADAEDFQEVMRCCAAALLSKHVFLKRFGPATVGTHSHFQEVMRCCAAALLSKHVFLKRFGPATVGTHSHSRATHRGPERIASCCSRISSFAPNAGIRVAGGCAGAVRHSASRTAAAAAPACHRRGAVRRVARVRRAAGGGGGGGGAGALRVPASACRTQPHPRGRARESTWPSNSPHDIECTWVDSHGRWKGRLILQTSVCSIDYLYSPYRVRGLAEAIQATVPRARQTQAAVPLPGRRRCACGSRRLATAHAHRAVACADPTGASCTGVHLRRRRHHGDRAAAAHARVSRRRRRYGRRGTHALRL